VTGSTTSAESDSPGWSWLLLVGALVAVTAARASALLALADQGYFAKYAAFAADILSGHSPVDRLGDLSPGYLWTVVGLTGPLGLGIGGVRLVQCAAVGAAALCAALIASRLAGKTAGWSAGLLLLSVRGVWVNASELEPETLVMVLNAAALALILDGRRGWRDLIGGALLGLSVTTRPTVLPAAGVLLAWRLLAVRGRRTPGRWIADPEGRSSPLPLALGLAAPILLLAFVLPRVGPVGLMNPGTVFYEGWNPEATGYLGEAPRVVKDIERTLTEPDALHVAYRIVAERATGRPDSNRFWGRLGLEALHRLPDRSFRLAVRKGWLALHSYDAWDLATMVRKDQELAGQLWVPFGVLVALAAVAVALARRRPAVVALGAFALAQGSVLVVFYVTSRQRNALVPAVAALAGVGVAELVRLWRRDRRAALAITLPAVVVAGVLVLPSSAAEEDAHAWRATFAARAAAETAERASSRGDSALATEALCEAALHLGPISPDLPLTALREAVAARLARPSTAAERFDLAIAAIRASDWATADRVLEALQGEGYRPRRGSQVTSSLAYQRARCRLHLGDIDAVPTLLATARREAPGEAAVLALSAELSRRLGEGAAMSAYATELEALHDPFTVERVRARAEADLGEGAEAARRLTDLADRLPEWRPTTPL